MRDQIREAMKSAMKAGDKTRTSILRMILADVQAAELAGQEIMDGITAFAKRVEKSIEEYRRLGKEEEVAKLQKERDVVHEFLPEALSDEALEAAVDEVIAAEGLTSMKDLGRGMKAVISAYGAQVDGRKASEMLKKKLGGK